jgi:predicted transcriptional regulator
MYDTECKERYGSKTCILLENQNIFEMRLLDVMQTAHAVVERDKLFEFVPKMLLQKYTVVIVENNNENKEITAVHLPAQSHLMSPPIIQ